MTGLFSTMVMKLWTRIKEVEDMMAMLWAQQIMYGKKTYAQVPRLLKEKVKELLIDSGCEELAVE